MCAGLGKVPCPLVSIEDGAGESNCERTLSNGEPGDASLGALMLVAASVNHQGVATSP